MEWRTEQRMASNTPGGTERDRETVRERAESSRVGLRQGLFTYSIADTDLAHGTSLGNARAWATSKGTGAIEGLFSIDLGLQITGSLVVNLFAPYKDLVQYERMEEQGRQVAADTLIRLSQVGIGSFTIHPCYQEHSYDLVGDVHVTETFFMPNTGFNDEAGVIQLMKISNRSSDAQTLAAIGCLYLPGESPNDMQSRYDGKIGGIVAWNQSNPDWVRAFGCVPHPDAHVTTHDIEEAWDPVYPLANTTDEVGEIVASLQSTLFLRPGETKQIAFIVAFTPKGTKDISRVYGGFTDVKDLLDRTVARYSKLLHQADVMTPDALINQGVQWSKANMLRVLANYPIGISFTNDPGRSSNVVARDVAWFVHGTDFMLPEASCDMLRQIAARQEESGKIIEYYSALDGSSEDYGLNINDNTPLTILASAHHIEVTGHEACRKRLYPTIRKAADYIISQEDDRGLVYCSAEGTGVHGIAGWRNIIDGRSINGAVTEINSECYAALLSASRIAEMDGESDKSRYFADEAAKLRDAINKHLKNPNNGMYYLNIDIHGNAITEVTSDQIFPMIFGVSDEETSQLITLRLSNPDFMTSAGLRTSSSLSPRYQPDTLVGLEGGVWPGVTWWYAMASVESDPAVMVDSLKKSYQQYTVRPGAYNTVPGQFSEWFDGESLVNRGMRLSPWEPPRFLWAAIEGAVGLNVEGAQVKVSPRIPRDWSWLRVRNLLTAAGNLSFFAVRYEGGLTFHTTSRFLDSGSVEVYDQELTDLLDPVSQDTVEAAFANDREILLCFGDTSGDKKPAPFRTTRLLDNARRYNVQIYQSEIGKWINAGRHSGGKLGRLTVEIAPHGFVLFRFRH